MAGGAWNWFVQCMHKEPVVMWSLFIGGLGLALPAVGPPVMDYFETKPIKTIKPMQVADALSKR